MKKAPLYVSLLHEKMHNKNAQEVTTSLTLIDVHDLARSCRTFGVQGLFICHPADTLRQLSSTLLQHWQTGYGASYNPDRKAAMNIVTICASLDNAIDAIRTTHSTEPILVATSALQHPGESRVSFKELSQQLKQDERPHLLMLGTGWGMSPSILDRAHFFLEPIAGSSNYNHLSVRSAAAIMLDRLFQAD